MRIFKPSPPDLCYMSFVIHKPITVTRSKMYRGWDFRYRFERIDSTFVTEVSRFLL